MGQGGREGKRKEGEGRGRKWENMCVFLHTIEFVILKALVSISVSYFTIPSSCTR